MDMPPPRYSAAGSDVPQCVTSLLDSTKELTECLQRWSVGRATEKQVSDVYVAVGTRFNVMVSAFITMGIDMSELYSIPVDLRVRLEECLSEDASPSILAQHMPAIRSTLYRLLAGLKGKQDAYWIAVGRRDRTSTGSSSFRRSQQQ